MKLDFTKVRLTEHVMESSLINSRLVSKHLLPAFPVRYLLRRFLFFDSQIFVWLFTTRSTLCTSSAFRSGLQVTNSVVSRYDRSRHPLMEWAVYEVENTADLLFEDSSVRVPHCEEAT